MACSRSGREAAARFSVIPPEQQDSPFLYTPETEALNQIDGLN